MASNAPSAAGMYVRVRDTLIKARKRLGMTQADVAKKIGVTRQAVGAWESGASNPDFINFFGWAAAVGVEIAGIT